MKGKNSMKDYQKLTILAFLIISAVLIAGCMSSNTQVPVVTTTPTPVLTVVPVTPTVTENQCISAFSGNCHDIMQQVMLNQETRERCQIAFAGGTIPKAAYTSEMKAMEPTCVHAFSDPCLIEWQHYQDEHCLSNA